MVTLHCHLPDPRLARDVVRYVIVDDDVPRNYQIVRNTLYIDVDGAEVRVDDAPWRGDQFGIMSHRAVAREKRGGRIVVVNFQNGGPSRLYGLDAGANLGLFGNGEPMPHPDLAELGDAVRAAGDDVAAICAALDRGLLARLPRREPEGVAEQAFEAIVERPIGTVRIAELAGEIGVAHRTLQRAYKRRYGVTMARHLRMWRFGLGIMRPNGATPTWAKVPLSLGYVDQSHFLRDARDLAGVPPDALGGAFGIRVLCYPRGDFRPRSAREDPRELRDWHAHYARMPGGTYLLRWLRRIFEERDEPWRRQA